jgi:hypothetical protein
MALRMMSDLPARVAQVPKDYLPAELDLIDAEEADGITTPDIADADYHEWDRPVIPEYPACSIRTISSTPIRVNTTGVGTEVDTLHRIDLMFHATHAQANQNALTLQKLMHRYVNGAMRVLCVVYEALQTSGDPTRYVFLTSWAGRPDGNATNRDSKDRGTLRRTSCRFSGRDNR